MKITEFFKEEKVMEVSDSGTHWDKRVVFVKYNTATGKLKYGVWRYVPLGIGNDWTVEGSTSRKIIGWRQIEEDSL